MPQLRFSLDGVVFDHPINWMDVKIRYKRDDVVRGLFTTFTSDMVWTGAEYAYLVNLWDNLTCDTADLLIESRCGRYGTWTTLLEGKLMLNTAKIDRQKCTLTCNAEQSGCQGTFFNNLETLIDIGQAGTPGTDAWLEIIDTFAVCGMIVSPVLPIPPVCAAYTPSPPIGGAFGKSFNTIFSQLVDAATNGCMSFISDYFSTPIQTELWNIDFQVASTIGHIITLQFDDYFGNTHIHNITSTGNSIQDAELMHYCLIYKLNAAPFSSTATEWAAGTSKYNKGEVGYDTWVAGATDFDMAFHYPPINLSISYPSGTIVLTQLNAGDVDGASNFTVVPALFRATGNYTVSVVAGVNWAQLASRAYQISFKEFFEMADKYFNLGMQIEPDGLGGWRVRVEPIEYFYTAAPTITLRNLKEVIHSADENLFPNIWRTGKITDQENTSFYDFNPEETTFPGSIQSTTSCNSEWYVATADNCVTENDGFRLREKKWILGVGTSFQDEMLLGIVENDDFNYIIQTYTPVPLNPFQARQYRYDSWAFTSIASPGVDVDLYRYDVHGQPERIYILHRNMLSEHDNLISTYQTTVNQPPALLIPFVDIGTYSWTPSVATIPEGAYWLPYEWKFKEYISDADWVLLVSSQIITVNETNNPANDQNGYLKEVTYRISDGNTEFIIEAKA